MIFLNLYRMKRVIFLILGFVCSVSVFSQKTVNYTVTGADVYLSGAKIYSQSKVQLEAGTHTVVIKNITNSLVEGSIQAKVSEGCSLVSVSSSMNYMESGELTQKEKELYESQKKLNNQLKLLQIDQDVNQDEINLITLLIKTPNNSEKKTNYTVTELQDLSKFYASKTAELKKSNYRIEQEMKTVKEELSKIEAQLREEKSVKNKNNQQVEVMLNVTSSGTKTIELTYFVYDCGWIPQYDIKAENKDNPIELIYKASVWQRTGVDWSQAAITLMTNQPAQDQNRPILSPLFVDILVPPPAMQSTLMKSSAKGSADAVQMNMLEMVADEMKLEDFGEYGEMSGNIVYNWASAISTDINISYKVAGKQTVEGNGKSKLLTLDTKKIPARFVYHAVPKLNEQVYLLAYISHWHNLNLINGTASIYLQDVFIGNIAINEKFTGEEYPLSFGVDNRISIKRNKKQDFSSESKVSSEKREKISYEFAIRNNLATSIEVEVLDQVPISKNKSIKVVLEDKGAAEYTENIGLLKWTVPVDAGKSTTFGFSYELRYPKENSVHYTGYSFFTTKYTKFSPQGAQR
jgi:uncharacterized protein (TIGR02231 family)